MKPEQIRRLRKKRGWTQAQLAKEVGVTRNTVARWERGEMAIGGPAVLLLKRVALEGKEME